MSEKQAEVMGTNEDQTFKGKLNVYDTPPGRRPGTIDALWGDEPPPRPLGHVGDYGSGVVEQAKNVRHGVLGRILNNLPEAKANSRAVVSQLLAHAASGEYESHSAELAREKTSSVRHLVDEPSLTEQVMGAFGRR